MESLLEQQRRLHEERERLMEAMVGEELCRSKVSKTHRELLNSTHRQRAMLDRYLEVTGLLQELYEDKDGQRRQEVAALSGPPGSEFFEFYHRLKEIKEFHRKSGPKNEVPMLVEFEELRQIREGGQPTSGIGAVETVDMVEFSDEECYGKFLDLHECYNLYVNLDKGRANKVDYITYLSVFDRLYEAVARDRKGSAEYRRYLGTMADYLFEFTRKVKPLLDLSAEMEFVRKDFDARFNAGDFPGWPTRLDEDDPPADQRRRQPPSGGQSGGQQQKLDLSGFSSAEELASLGLDRLKAALTALGMKCGGTLEERAARLFSTKGKDLGQIDPGLFAKKKSSSAGKGFSGLEKLREVAALEAQVYHLTELLSEVRAATKENVERKQARTEHERGEDSGDEDLSDEEQEKGGEDDDIPYNPKNLPLGWDGKPIPYWLYKMHGLNISYNCEICGNFTYKGPKAFQRHFAEWRHAHGLLLSLSLCSMHYFD